MDINKEKIDIVYNWIDGSDPEWRAKRDYWAQKENPNNIVLNNCRTFDNDELKYSLRSLEKYANWINKVYIIVDKQCPKWLNTDNNRIKIIDLNEIVPEKYLPTFNSNVIEHHIVNIPDLSEYFLYSCDDMFFAKYTPPSFFFAKNNLPVIRFSHTYPEDNKTLYYQALVNADNLILKHFNFKLSRYPHHNIDSYKKSDVIKCRDEFIENLTPTFSNRFRKEDDIQRVIYSKYALALKRGIYKNAEEIFPPKTYYKYIPLARKFVRLFNKIFMAETVFFSADEKEYNLKNKRVKLFCINDNEETGDTDRTRVKNLLETLFPDKSSFEL